MTTLPSLVPPDAHRLEEIQPGVVVYDVEHLLPVHPSKRYALRDGTPQGVIVHHSGGDNHRVGFAAVKPAANWHVYHHGWPGMAYHYFIGREPVKKDGKLVVWKTQRENAVSYHARGCNAKFIGLCLQGHLGNYPMSASQEECLEAWLTWWFVARGIDPRKGLGWHSGALRFGGVPKLACPGRYVVGWLEDWVAKV